MTKSEIHEAIDKEDSPEVLSKIEELLKGEAKSSQTPFDTFLDAVIAESDEKGWLSLEEVKRNLI